MCWSAADSIMSASRRAAFWCGRLGASQRTACPFTTSTWRQYPSGSFRQISAVIGSGCKFPESPNQRWLT
jgi:hypothetical protein